MQGFVFVTTGHIITLLHHKTAFLANNRNVPHRAQIRLCGVQTHKAPLTHDLAIGIEFVDANQIIMGIAVDGGTLLRFAQNQTWAAEPTGFFMWLKIGETTGIRVYRPQLEQAQATVLVYRQLLRTFIVLGQIVFTEAHEQEMVGRQPIQKGQHLFIVLVPLLLYLGGDLRQSAAHQAFIVHHFVQSG